MAVANSLAYYIMEIITTIKSLIVQALGEQLGTMEVSFMIYRAANFVVIMFIVQAIGHSAMVINDTTRGIIYDCTDLRCYVFSSTCHFLNR
jgi:hypothetical protein